MRDFVDFTSWCMILKTNLNMISQNRCSCILIFLMFIVIVSFVTSNAQALESSLWMHFFFIFSIINCIILSINSIDAKCDTDAVKCIISLSFNNFSNSYSVKCLSLFEYTIFDQSNINAINSSSDQSILSSCNIRMIVFTRICWSNSLSVIRSDIQ
jgi:cytochrome bd-type quinol oxidase subunit 2